MRRANKGELSISPQRFYLFYSKIGVIVKFLNRRFSNLSAWKYWAIEVDKR